MPTKFLVSVVFFLLGGNILLQVDRRKRGLAVEGIEKFLTGHTNPMLRSRPEGISKKDQAHPTTGVPLKTSLGNSTPDEQRNQVLQVLVWEAIGRMSPNEASKPDAKPGWVVLDVEAAGICGSEISAFLGKNELRKPPLVMGHEFSGVVV